MAMEMAKRKPQEGTRGPYVKRERRRMDKWFDFLYESPKIQSKYLFLSWPRARKLRVHENQTAKQLDTETWYRVISRKNMSQV